MGSRGRLSSTNPRRLVLFGDGLFAEVAHEYFTRQSPYQVAGFTVTAEFLHKDRYHGLPVVPFEEVTRHFPPESHDMFIAVTFGQLNRHRQRFYAEAKQLGYTLASFVSPHALVWPGVTPGDNSFIFEQNVIQPFVTLGSNLILWSGNHIGHHAAIESHCFLASHVVVSGSVRIGESCFLGVNSTVAHNVRIGRDCLIGAGAFVIKDLPRGTIVKGLASLPEPLSTYDKFGLDAKD